MNRMDPAHATVIPAQAGIQLFEPPAVEDQYLFFAGYADWLSCWIPACAGMTVLNESEVRNELG